MIVLTGRALLLIDFARDFIDPDGTRYVGEGAKAAVAAAAAALTSASARGDLVIHACDRHSPDDAEFSLSPRSRPHCVEGTPGAAFVPELKPAPGEIVLFKRRFNAFFCTSLENILREQGMRELDVAGVSTNVCVLYTVADARLRGFAVRVLAAAVTSYDREAHDFALGQMEQVLGARVSR